MSTDGAAGIGNTWWTAAHGGICAAVCTVILLLRPGHPWPVLVAANRDERLDREWDHPDAHWPNQPGVVAGRDRLGGGTWMAMRAGLMAAVLNRPGSLGPAAGKLSRGGLPLLALQQRSAAEAFDALMGLDGTAYRSFNMVVADRHSAHFIRCLGRGRPDGWALSPGLQMVTAHDPNDHASPRTRRMLPRFVDAAPPDPAQGDWAEWQALLGDRSGDPATTLNVAPREGFGTVCSSLVALPAEGPPVWLFAAGPPDQARFAPVAMVTVETLR
jgi:hypothetical protein